MDRLASSSFPGSSLETHCRAGSACRLHRARGRASQAAHSQAGAWEREGYCRYFQQLCRVGYGHPFPGHPFSIPAVTTVDVGGTGQRAATIPSSGRTDREPTKSSSDADRRTAGRRQHVSASSRRRREDPRPARRGPCSSSIATAAIMAKVPKAGTLTSSRKRRSLTPEATTTSRSWCRQSRTNRSSWSGWTRGACRPRASPNGPARRTRRCCGNGSRRALRVFP